MTLLLTSGCWFGQVADSVAVVADNWLSVSATQLHSTRWFYCWPKLRKNGTRNHQQETTKIRGKKDKQNQNKKDTSYLQQALSMPWYPVTTIFNRKNKTHKLNSNQYSRKHINTCTSRYWNTQNIPVGASQHALY
jgi:hypothetical protein